MNDIVYYGMQDIKRWPHDDIMNLITIGDGVIFGSSVFCNEGHKFEDIDVLIMHDKVEKYLLSNNCLILGYQYDELSGSGINSAYIVSENEQIYNLCLASSKEAYNEWKMASDAMIDLVDNHQEIKDKVSEDKKYRVELYRILRKAYEAK